MKELIIGHYFMAYPFGALFISLLLSLLVPHVYKQLQYIT